MSDLPLAEWLAEIAGKHDDCSDDWCAYHYEGQRECAVPQLISAVRDLTIRLAAAEAENERLRTERESLMIGIELTEDV